jgi:hypothetical protein
MATSNQQPATSNQQPATSNQQPATSNQQPATSNQQPATRNPQPATSNHQRRPGRRNVRSIPTLLAPIPGPDVRCSPYIIKPPFPSDGGCAAASAGRSGLRPSVGHVRESSVGAPSRLDSRPERQLAHADAPAFSDCARGLPLDQIHGRCSVAWRTVVRGQGPKRNHEPNADFFSEQLP